MNKNLESFKSYIEQQYLSLAELTLMLEQITMDISLETNNDFIVAYLESQRAHRRDQIKYRCLNMDEQEKIMWYRLINSYKGES